MLDWLFDYDNLVYSDCNQHFDWEYDHYLYDDYYHENFGHDDMDLDNLCT